MLSFHLSPLCFPRRYLDPSLLVALLARTQRFYWPDADAAFGAAVASSFSSSTPISNSGSDSTSDSTSGATVNAASGADPYLSADELRTIRERIKRKAALALANANANPQK
jgi:hypothetical protein